jgi:hypothetical protein
VASAAALGRPGIRSSKRRCSGEKIIASVTPQKIASYSGHKMAKKASDTAINSHKKTLLWNEEGIMAKKKKKGVQKEFQARLTRQFFTTVAI